ncbi:LysM peptidoglycan-binding domain-containing protein [Candidatus Gottesmanbacteria bacterium]|nr:LysM peptidoglycan-binding domain-containing protein [Candidatus Gottesmanbacteria bacterium]
MAVGLLVVIIIALAAFNFFTRKNDKLSLPGIQAPEVSQVEKKDQNQTVPATHTVAAGENLWTISSKYYQSGYFWLFIAERNHLADPNILFVGQKLEIPKVEIARASTQPSEDVIKTDQYVVAQGDSLWKISLRAYNNGYGWTRLASENKIPNPDLIYPGQNLKIPR